MRYLPQLLSEKMRQRLERVDSRIETYKTKNKIGTAGRLNAALSLVKTPYFLLVEDDIIFTSTVRISKVYSFSP